MPRIINNPGVGIVRQEHISGAINVARTTVPHVFEAITIGWCSGNVPLLAIHAKKLARNADYSAQNHIPTASLIGVLLGTNIVRRLTEDGSVDLAAINQNASLRLFERTFTVGRAATTEELVEDFGEPLAASFQDNIRHQITRTLCADTVELCLTMPNV